ncbi:hypothetical protein CRE_10989 [Caenorhabditis remanei]|uniref:Acyl_transf_3 domain-containing protein n=1 Tax=Caenorhabditis remanei TaxID=31234 RepID=E3M5W0_CAERE|nr:hypothetical protein CRE_10989 [Caenorhabditis remanei]
MDLPKPKPSKRLDLQGIRALAIIVVLGFHFYPEYCPNGYLGVDQFFVLSGFLMCMLLKRAENESTCSLVTLFYSKRFKRILPLYLIIIFIAMICLYNYFPDTAIELNQESAVHALLFVSNRPTTDQEDYFQMLSIAVDIFTHTWSLSVEIHFYFLVPFIFLFASDLPGQYQYGYYGIIGMVVYLLTIPKSADSYEALQKQEEVRELLMTNENQEVDDSPSESRSARFTQPAAYFFLIVLTFVNTYPVALPALIVRYKKFKLEHVPLVTIGTGCLMLISDENLILSNKVLTYIGDISYSLYLIHWPIYAYWKLSCNGDQIYLFIALTSSILLAIITYETFEKWYLKLSSTSIGLMVVILFFLNITAIKKQDIMDRIYLMRNNVTSLDEVTYDMTIEDAIRLNTRWSVNDMKNLYAPSCVYEKEESPFGWCRHKVRASQNLSTVNLRSQGLSKSGKYKLAIIGNSWTANHAKLFYQECGYKAKSIMQGSASGEFRGTTPRKTLLILGCEPFFPSMDKERCRRNFTDYAEHIEKEKPDFAFVISRYLSIGGPLPENVTSFDEDPTYQTMKAQMMKFISNIKYKMYILDAFPAIDRWKIPRIGFMMRNGTDPVAIDNMLVRRTSDYFMSRKRYAQLLKDCGEKCIMIDYVPEFYKRSTNTFRTFDKKGFSYFTTEMHLTPHGIEKIRHIWKDICGKL